ncbi:hypothetical protein [Mulberry dwarf phytoplasma]|uniref:hypothetical protein n=1 Tax=Mulberry dwarf phytoplasma TaxID=186171 RepID=UPI001D0FBFD8|nr:hypothetical protein [Mulberry dwarf phytoplasma]
MKLFAIDRKFGQKYNIILLLLVLLVCLIRGNHHVWATTENSESKINHVLLEQPYPIFSPEELVNFYTKDQLKKQLKLNNYPSYNANDNLDLNVAIKNAPTNLLGVWFDGGVRSTLNNDAVTVENTMKQLREMANDHQVKQVYFFYDNTDYCDLTVNLQLEKNLYFNTFKKDWNVPSEWRPWFWSYEEWRDHWYCKKTPREKGYSLLKSGEQGFKIVIAIDETANVFLVPVHAIDVVYQDNTNFRKIKNFTLKTDLGDGIEIDYDKPMLRLHTDNSFGDFLNKVYEVGDYFPIVSTVLSGVNFAEGMLQDNEGQIIDGGFGLALDALTFGASSILKGGTKTITKGAVKGTVKKTTTKVAQKPLRNIVNTFLKKQLQKTFSLNNIVVTDTKKIFQKTLEANIFTPQPIIIDLGNNTKLTVLPKSKSAYNIENKEKIIMVNHEGEIMQINE